MGQNQSIVSVDALLHWWAMLTDTQKSLIATSPSEARDALETACVKIVEAEFVSPIRDDAEAISILVAEGMRPYNEEEHTDHEVYKASVRKAAAAKVKSWRDYAATRGYTGPVVWQVKAGFWLKTHAPKAGPCHDGLRYLQDWNLSNDDATQSALVFWIPRLAEGSTSKNVTKMEELRSHLREQNALPEGHCDRFGSVALLFALLLAHFKRTGERVPLRYLYAASDTLNADGYRLIAGDFDESGLCCSSWDDSYAYDDVGFFLLGVESLGN